MYQRKGFEGWLFHYWFLSPTTIQESYSNRYVGLLTNIKHVIKRTADCFWHHCVMITNARTHVYCYPLFENGSGL